ncbi:hypothetical protein [Thalassotalea ganghwensis]
MKTPNDKDLEKSFEQWLEDENVARDPGLESTLADDKQWRDRLDVARHIKHHADVVDEQDVPTWDRGAAFHSEKKPWWAWSGMPALSMCSSVFAVLLVVFRVEFSVGNGQLNISFADSNQVKQQLLVEQMVDQKLQSFASEQQVVLANYAADIKVKQQENNLQLASYLMEASRKERKEDISSFIQYVNEQRTDDQFNNQLKFKQLERALFYSSANNEQPKLTTTDWATEE